MMPPECFSITRQEQLWMDETLKTWAGSGLILKLENLNLFCLTGLITMMLLMSKWVALFMRKNHL